jgi:hypothetical protein
MKKIPLFAGRCPYCLDENQGVHGRIAILLLILAAIVAAAFWGSAYLERRKNDRFLQDIGRRLQDPEIRRQIDENTLMQDLEDIGFKKARR